MALRGHEPIRLDVFNGLYQKGDAEETPPDHFTDCENIRFIGNSSFGTRYGIDQHQNVAVPLGNIVRQYNYVTQDGSTLLVLTLDHDTNIGTIFHVVNSITVFGPILTIQDMTDFGFVSYAGRAYLTPFNTFAQGDLLIQKGLQNEFLYVYDGSLNPGAVARTAGIAPPVGTITIANGAAGHTDAGFHLFGVVFETDTGALSAPGAFNGFDTTDNLSVSFSTVPTGPSTVIRRHIVATKVIENYNGDETGFQYFFIPNAVINDNVTTTLNNISFFDGALLADASHLLDNFSQIPAGVGLCVYHNRLCLFGEFDNISVVRVSAVGEPEAISQISGLLIVPPDGNPITNGAELRDILYIMKRARTVSYVDNDDVPSSWPMTVVDNAIGCGVHGIASVIDTGSSSVDYLIVASLRGLIIFTGRYILPELSWKISDFWLQQDRSLFNRIQVLIDPVNQVIYSTLTDYRLLVGDYSNGLDPKSIRWTPWKFDIQINTIALVNINELILGSDARLNL